MKIKIGYLDAYFEIEEDLWKIADKWKELKENEPLDCSDKIF